MRLGSHRTCENKDTKTTHAQKERRFVIRRAFEKSPPIICYERAKVHPMDMNVHPIRGLSVLGTSSAYERRDQACSARNQVHIQSDVA